MATRMLLTRYVWNPLRTNSERNPSSVGVKMKRIANVSTGWRIEVSTIQM